MSGYHSKCCEPKKKVFQGKAFIPDDHIQLISKYFQGANLNLNFAVDDEENSDGDCCKKKRKTRSRSRKRSRKKRKRKAKRCKCCKCHEEKSEIPKGCCCGNPATSQTKPSNRTCFEQTDPCPPPPRNCCEAKPEPCGAKSCCEGKTQVAPIKNSVCCCVKPVEPEPEKLCCCCGRPCVGNNNDDTKRPNKQESVSQENAETIQAKGKSSIKLAEEGKLAEDGTHRHTSCCCKCNGNVHDVKNDADDDVIRKEVSKNDKHKKSSKKPPPIRFSESSDSAMSSSSKGGNVKQVYVTRNVSNLENDAVYGRYWYHRPPLENTITHCDEDDYPGPSGYRNDVGYRNDRRPYEDGCGPDAYDGRFYPPNSTYAYNAVQYSETGDRFRGSGRCMACKEPMCLLCKMSVCECDCDKPNFVICNPCKRRLMPKPPKKPCPPRKPKPKTQPQQVNEGCDEAMFLLPLLASMQAGNNSNFQQCDC